MLVTALSIGVGICEIGFQLLEDIITLFVP
jgi:hypothetical protein